MVVYIHNPPPVAPERPPHLVGGLLVYSHINDVDIPLGECPKILSQVDGVSEVYLHGLLLAGQRRLNHSGGADPVSVAVSQHRQDTRHRFLTPKYTHGSGGPRKGRRVAPSRSPL